MKLTVIHFNKPGTVCVTCMVFLPAHALLLRVTLSTSRNGAVSLKYCTIYKTYQHTIITAQVLFNLKR